MAHIELDDPATPLDWEAVGAETAELTKELKVLRKRRKRLQRRWRDVLAVSVHPGGRAALRGPGDGA